MSFGAGVCGGLSWILLKACPELPSSGSPFSVNPSHRCQEERQHLICGTLSRSSAPSSSWGPQVAIKRFRHTQVSCSCLFFVRKQVWSKCNFDLIWKREQCQLGHPPMVDSSAAVAFFFFFSCWTFTLPPPASAFWSRTSRWYYHHKPYGHNLDDNDDDD